MLRIVSRLFVFVVLAASLPVFAVDGIVLINQSTVMAAGGFPYKITQPGSYKLTGNLVVPADTNGIEIQAAQVTLDLNGFGLIGAVVCDVSCTPFPTDTTAGVNSFAQSSTIRNGFVRGFSRGIKTIGGIVEEIQATGNIFGIEAHDTLIRRNFSSFNQLDGFQVITSVLIENIAVFNGGQGYNLGGAAVFGSNLLKSSHAPGINMGSLVVTQHNSSCLSPAGGGPC